MPQADANEYVRVSTPERTLWVSTPMESDRTLNIAHRGASAAAPPNTLAAFKKAVELGADGIEFDVHFSADGVPVVIHDFTVDATTDGSGRVADLTLAQLKQLDAGTRFDPAFTGERIPTLDEVLEAVRGRRRGGGGGADEYIGGADEYIGHPLHPLLLNIELKTTSPGDNGLERAVITLVEQHSLSRRVLFSSFNPFSLRRAKRIAPHIPAGLLYDQGLSLPLRRAWLAFLAPHEARHPHYKMVDARYMAWARRRGYRVNTWTVDDPAEMRRLVGLGVNGIITNVPDVLRSVLESQA